MIGTAGASAGAVLQTKIVYSDFLKRSKRFGFLQKVNVSKLRYPLSLLPLLKEILFLLVSFLFHNGVFGAFWIS